jgi:hypothetical protein
MTATTATLRNDGGTVAIASKALSSGIKVRLAQIAMVALQL